MENIINEAELEKMREKTKKLNKIFIILSVISFLLYICFFCYMVKKGSSSGSFSIELAVFAGILLIIIAIILWFVIVGSSYNKFNYEFKSKYVVQTINNIEGFDDLKYYQENGFNWDDIRNTAVVDCGDKRYFKSEDLLFGIYDNVRFKISDVMTRKMVRRDKKNRIKEIFSGQVICLFQFDEMKISNGHVQIFENEFLSNMSGWKADNEIYTENEAFNKRFSVYASDEHNAYYILTPQRMEKIISFADTIDGQVSLVFLDDKLFVAVRNESMFDADLSEPVKEQTAKIIKDAEFIQKAKEILVEQ